MDKPLAKERLDEIAAHARLVCKTAAEDGAKIGLDRSGVVWLDGFVQQQFARDGSRGDGPQTDDKPLGSSVVSTAGGIGQADGLVEVLGSYLGECLIAAYGGAWCETKNGIGVSFHPKNVVAYPFAKVRKQLTEGAAESVLSMFDVIRVLLGQADADLGGTSSTKCKGNWLTRLFTAPSRG